MNDLFKLYIQTFDSGGILILLLAIIAFYIYYTSINVLFKISSLIKICKNPKVFKGAYDEFIDENFENIPNVNICFNALRLNLLEPLNRRLKMVKILSTIAPLLGLLGTVSGLSLSMSSGVDINMIASGISKALITTQTGLIVAIPSWIMAIYASSKMQNLLIFMAKHQAIMNRKLL